MRGAVFTPVNCVQNHNHTTAQNEKKTDSVFMILLNRFYLYSYMGEYDRRRIQRMRDIRKFVCVWKEERGEEARARGERA